MNLAAHTLAAAMNIGEQAAELWLPHVNAALELCGCRTSEHVAMWLAQVGHESAGLTRLVESLNYTPKGLLATWPNRYTRELAEAHGRTATKPADQRAIALHVYGSRLGNRHGTEDGWIYRGRGPIQVTGRANYLDCGRAIGVDLIDDPDALQLRSIGCASTSWYWRKHRLTGFGGDVHAVTRRINGGLNGLADRTVRYARAIAVLR